MALNWRTYHVPLSAGRDGKADKRALPTPQMDEIKNARWAELGGLQTAYPFASIGTDIVGGGTIANVRKMAAYDDELLCFTSTEIYSWSASESAWKHVAEYLAPHVTETQLYNRPSEQVDADRAVLDGVVYHTWVELGGSGPGVYIAASDEETGAVLLAPTTVVSASATRPRLVATSTRVHLFYITTANVLTMQRLDPSDPATLPGLLTVDSSVSYYDVRIDPNDDTRIFYTTRVAAGTYRVGYIVGAAEGGLDVSRTTDGPMAIAPDPSGALYVLRCDGTTIYQDPIADPNVSYTPGAAVAVGTPSTTPDQITAAFRTGGTGPDVFWSVAEAASDTAAFLLERSHTAGTEVTIARQLGLASHAFEHDGDVYFWASFAGESDVGVGEAAGFRSKLQNTYFLYRHDGTLMAKAVAGLAGGFANSAGHLPSVQNTSGNKYVFEGIKRRIVPLGDSASDVTYRKDPLSKFKKTAGLKARITRLLQTDDREGYSSRVPVDVSVEFDSDEARRTAQLGRTLYISGGMILQYDGINLVEAGFHVAPWTGDNVGNSSGGSVEDGTYADKVTWRWDNARGERDRSTSAVVGKVTVSGGSGSGSINFDNVPSTQATLKTNICAEMWRTVKNPPVGAPFYLSSGQDPATTTGDNKYCIVTVTDQHSPSVYLDALADEDLRKKEQNPENYGVLENIAPPPAGVIVSNGDRLFLAGIAGKVNACHYSKYYEDSTVAAFHEALSVETDPTHGAVTAIAFLNETLVVFKERAIYMLPGDGFDNLGQGQNYGPPRVLATDVGAVSAESVCRFPGGLLFKSQKGFYLLDRGWSVQYVGGAVADYDTESVVAAHTMETEHEVRFLTASRMLVWDYLANAWGEREISGARGAVLWNGEYVYCSSSNIYQEQSAYSSMAWGLDVTTGWLKPGDLMDYGRCRKLQVLGEYRSACRVRVRVAFDYDESDASGPNYVYDNTLTVSPTTVGGPLQMECYLPGGRQKCEAFKVRITAIHASTADTPPAGEAIKLTGLGFEVGFKGRLNKRLPPAQRQ